MSICIDRSKLSNDKLLQRLNKMLENRIPYSTIIQADGAPMSGGENDYKTTLQAVAIRGNKCQVIRISYPVQYKNYRSCHWDIRQKNNQKTNKF